MLICLYLLDGNVLTTPCLLCLLYVSCVAFCCALCIFEKLGRLYICFDMHFSWKQGEEFHIPWHAFVMKTRGRASYTLIHALSTRGRSCMHLGRICEIFHVRRKIEKRDCICSGGLCICAGGAPLVCLSFVLCGVLFVSFVCLGCVELLPLP